MPQNPKHNKNADDSYDNDYAGCVASLFVLVLVIAGFVIMGRNRQKQPDIKKTYEKTQSDTVSLRRLKSDLRTANIMNYISAQKTK